MKKSLLSAILCVLSIGMIAQTNDPVIMTINGKDFKKSEFEYFYNKYNNEDILDKRDLNEYIGLFRNLKLKVIEAETQGLDTTTTFLTEFAGYRSSEAKSYLEDLEINEELLRKEYDRMKDLFEISHLLVAYPSVITNNDFKMFPTDTAEIYKKALQIRNRILKGENFEKMVLEFSDDANSKGSENPGYLGWYSGMMLNPSLENGVFNTPVGKVSQLVRTNFGYHIVKVQAKKENPGTINAAHILIPCPVDADATQKEEALNKINEIYDELVKGGDFALLAKENSKDPGSAPKGGDLGWFGFGAMVKEFQDAAFGLKEIGAISKPFKTQFGYHIVKLLEKKPLEPFEEKRKEIENKLNTGGYFISLHQPGIEKMKKEFGFQKEAATYTLLFSAVNTVYPTDSMFYKSFETRPETLFKIGNTPYSVENFIRFLKKNTRSPYTTSSDLLNDRLQMFEYNSLLEAKDNSLENNYPEFRNLIQEYRDGILMFDMSNREVWEKASEDIEGLKAYFEKNKEKYAWNEPYFKGYAVWVKDTKTKKKMQKEIAKMQSEAAIQYLNENYKVGEVSYLKSEKGLFKKGDNPLVDKEIFKSEKIELPSDFQDFFLLGNVLTAPESYTDVRGLVVTDYQNYLEENWIKKLNEKYKVTIYPEVLKTIK